MTDLSGSVLDKKIGDIAQYFSASARDVADALDFGARTYQDVYDYLERIKLEEKAPKPTIHFPNMKPEDIHISDRLHETLTSEEVKDLNAYHNDPNKVPKYAEIRAACENLMRVIYAKCPQSIDRTTAIQYVRMTRMWANSAIALEKTI